MSEPITETVKHGHNWVETSAWVDLAKMQRRYMCAYCGREKIQQLAPECEDDDATTEEYVK